MFSPLQLFVCLFIKHVINISGFSTKLYGNFGRILKYNESTACYMPVPNVVTYVFFNDLFVGKLSSKLTTICCSDWQSVRKRKR